MDNHPPGDNYPLKRVIIIHYVQIHLPKSSPSGFASHGHIGPVSGDAQTQVANSRQKTLSVLCKLSNLSTLFKTIQFGRTLDFFWANPSLSVSLWLKDPRSLCSWPSTWDVAKSGGHSQQVGMYNTVKLSKHPESTDCWWGLDSVPHKRGPPGGDGIKRYFVLWVCPGI